MKNAKYQEKDIAEHLAKEGRTNYHPKTIGTRWARIKRMIQKVQDQMLDDELTDCTKAMERFLNLLLQDDVLRVRLARHARASALAYSWDRIADEHLALFGDVRAARRQLVAAAHG